MEKRRNFISILLSVIIILTGVTPIFASEMGKNGIDLNQETLVELEIILSSIREQLIAQDAEDLYDMYEKIIIEKYNNLSNGHSVEPGSNVTPSGAAVSSGSGSLYYTYNDVEFFDIYLSVVQTKDYYDDLVYQKFGNGIVELILSLINGALSFGFYRQHVLINPLQEIINEGSRRANILTSIDHVDSGRKTMIVVDWGSAYPYMTYPSWAKNVKYTTPLRDF